MMLLGREVVFNVSTDVLYYNDTVERAIMIVNTVANNCEGFTRREHEGAKAARCALGLVRVLDRAGLFQHGKFQHDSELPRHQGSIVCDNIKKYSE